MKKIITVFSIIFINHLTLNSQSFESDFLRIGGKIATSSNEIKNVWPGFWSKNEPFMFIKHDSIVQVFNVNQKPSDDYVKGSSSLLPDNLKGRVFKKKSYLPEYEDRPKSFPGLYEINGEKIYALEPQGKNDFDQIDFYIHEAFHYYQRPNWEETSGDTIVIKFKTLVSDSLEQVSNSRYISLLHYERDLLKQGIYLKDKNEIETVLKKIIATRALRNIDLPQKVIDLIDRYERREGSAVYVGLKSSVVSKQYDADSLYNEISNELSRDLSEFPPYPSQEQQFIRWPYYGMGAALGVLFDKMEFDWKEELESGKTFHDILNSNITITQNEIEHIKNQIMEALEIDY